MVSKTGKDDHETASHEAILAKFESIIADIETEGDSLEDALGAFEDSIRLKTREPSQYTEIVHPSLKSEESVSFVTIISISQYIISSRSLLGDVRKLRKETGLDFPAGRRSGH